MGTWIVVGIVVLILIWLVLTYNGLVTLRNRTQEAWSEIDVELKRRHDLIPNLVQTVQGYMGHERGTLEAVTNARAGAVAAGGPRGPAKNGPAERPVDHPSIEAAVREILLAAGEDPDRDDEDGAQRIEQRIALLRCVEAIRMHAAIHDGCRLVFGPDGKLWATTGDNGDGRLAQDPTSLNGKVLRMNTDGSVPNDNPVLPGATAATVVYSIGHRNPQGLAFAPDGGIVLEIETGTTANDEINLLSPGKNYGWPDQEGRGGMARGFTDPVWTSGSVTYAASGATFVAGDAWGQWSGSLFIATLKEQDLRRFIVSGTTVVQQETLYDQKYGRLRSVVQGPDGALYVTTSNGSGDRIVRIAPQ